MVYKRRRTARTQARDISLGKIVPYFIGPASPEVVKQMIFSILNTKPDFRVKVWGEHWRDILENWVSQA